MNFVLAARQQLISKAKSSLAAHSYVKNFELARPHEKDFAKAVRKMWADFITPSVEHKFLHFWNRGKTLPELKALLPWFSITDPDVVWEDLQSELAKAYASALLASGQATTRDMAAKFGVRMVFGLWDGKTIEKSEPSKSEQRRLFAQQVITPVNPYSIAWMHTRSLTLIKESFTSDQRNVVGKILRDAFDRGIRATSIVESIRSNIGLTEQGFKAVERVRETYIKAELPLSRIDILVEKYRDKLLNYRALTIARTETQKAVSAGRNHAWKMAKDEGELPKTAIKQWVARPESPRLCDDCRRRDGTTAEIDGEYEPGISSPEDSHPDCGCTEVLIDSEEANE